jgi:succinate dehydrogenase/fumarate reductase cytochrome b subunit
MAVATAHRKSLIAADNHVLHRLHSLSGIVPIGIFLVQHLTLNSFALASPAHFNAVIDFFNEKMPWHLLFVLEWGFIFIPLLFHALYGLVITAHGQVNVGRYGYWRNWMYLWQRITGVILVVYIAAHVWGTTISHRLFRREHPLRGHGRVLPKPASSSPSTCWALRRQLSTCPTASGTSASAGGLP